jgi:hypothetical protein
VKCKNGQKILLRTFADFEGEDVEPTSEISRQEWKELTDRENNQTDGAMELTTADSGGNTAQNRENLTQNDAVNRENADA